MAMRQTHTDGDAIVASLAHPEVFAVVFDRHFSAIHRYLQRRVGREAAEELAADTFVQAFVHRATFHPERDDARPWLFGIATNLLRHHHRRERRRLQAYARTGRDPLADPGFDAVDARVDAGTAGPALALALAALAPADRDTLLLAVWAELSYAEVADALGVPIGTVRSRMHRARGRLRELLAASGQSMGEVPDRGGNEDG
jgi:RNA polymerase sigma factor (sigma-70 family)